MCCVQPKKKEILLASDKTRSRGHKQSLVVGPNTRQSSIQPTLCIFILIFYTIQIFAGTNTLLLPCSQVLSLRYYAKMDPATSTIASRTKFGGNERMTYKWRHRLSLQAKCMRCLNFRRSSSRTLSSPESSEQQSYLSTGELSRHKRKATDLRRWRWLQSIS